MRAVIGALVVGLSSLGWSQPAPGTAPVPMEGEDAGTPAVRPPPPAPVDAGVASAPSTTFDPAMTPWGPGRKSSGELFRSAAVAVDPNGPLRWRWNDVSAAVGLQYFARAEARDNADFSAAARDFSLGIEHRARVTGRVSAFGRVGAVLELQDVRAWGSEPSTIALLPAAALHQGFVDLKVSSWLDVRVGRQELSYGEDRLIGNLDWAQTARAFDGVFARVTPMEGVTVDAFGMALKPPAFLTDAAGSRFQNSGTYFTGLYARYRKGKAGLDVYGLGLLEDQSTAATGFRPDHNRLTLGGRGLLGLGPLALVGEGALQLGTTAAREQILAGAFAGRATWTLPFAGLYLMADVSAATGDGTPGDGTDTTFNQLFPTAHVHLGFIDYVAWQNVVGVRGTVGLKRPFMHLWLDVHHLRAWDPRGAWYAAGGSVFIPASAMRTNGEMGNEFDLSLTVPLHDSVSLSGAFSVFLPGGMADPAATGVGRGSSPSTWAFLYVRAQL